MKKISIIIVCFVLLCVGNCYGVSETGKQNLGCCCKSELRKWIGKQLYRTKPAQTDRGFDRSYMTSARKLLDVTCEKIIIEGEFKIELERNIWDDGGWALWEEPNVKEKKCCPCCCGESK